MDENNNGNFEQQETSPVVEVDTYESTSTTSTVLALDEEKKGFAITSLILGILSLLCCICYAGLYFGIPGLIFGILQKPNAEGRKPGMATAGIILSAIGLALTIGMIIMILFSPTFWDSFREGFERGYNGIY